MLNGKGNCARRKEEETWGEGYIVDPKAFPKRKRDP